MSFICHIHNYTQYNVEWNVFSAFNPSKCTHLEQWAADCAAPWEQSWTSCWSRDSNPQHWVTSGFKSNALSIRPTTAPLGQRLPAHNRHMSHPRTHLQHVGSPDTEDNDCVHHPQTGNDRNQKDTDETVSWKRCDRPWFALLEFALLVEVPRGIADERDSADRTVTPTRNKTKMKGFVEISTFLIHLAPKQKSNQWMHLSPFYTRVHGEWLRYAKSTSQFHWRFLFSPRWSGLPSKSPMSSRHSS